MKLIDFYTKIEAEIWDYYNGNSSDNIEILPYKSEKAAFEFIKAYFVHAGKEGLLLKNLSKMSGRWIHTVSTFFLGLVLAKDVLYIDLNKVDKFGNRKNLYLWYLTCLYHDYGYLIENKKNKFPPCKMTLNAILMKVIGNESVSLLNEFPFDLNEFSRNDVVNYFESKRMQYGFVNHGVVGGLLLYYELCKILNDILGANNECHRNGLYWNWNQVNDFARCANSIIAHNIWFDSHSSIKKFVLKNNNKHIYNDWLTALLVLCDTIEPTKRFTCCKSEYVLEKINMEICHGAVSIDLSEFKCCNVDIYIKQCAKLQEWTNLSVDFNETHVSFRNVDSLYRNN